MRVVRVIHEPSGKVLAEKAVVAENPASRALGLLVVPKLEPGEGLWLKPCTGVHTFGMSYSLDVVLVDESGRVNRYERDLKPFKVLWKPGADVASVLEMPSGALEGINIEQGDTLRFEEVQVGRDSEGTAAGGDGPSGGG